MQAYVSEMNGEILIEAAQRYASLMSLVKLRLNKCSALVEAPGDLFALESVALHIRKILEAIAYGGVIACEMRLGIEKIPRQIKNNWNAEDVFNFLEAKNLLSLPKYAEVGSKDDEGFELKIHDGKPQLLPWLKEIYQQSHSLLHEFHPYRQWDLYEGKADQGLKTAWAGAAQHTGGLREWLWTHVIDLEHRLYVVQFHDGEEPVTVMEANNFRLLN